MDPMDLADWLEARKGRIADRWMSALGASRDRDKVLVDLGPDFCRTLVSFLPGVLTAYRQRTLPLIHGTLRSISADALADERTGEHYFLAKVEVAPEDLAELDDIELMPGMPAEIMLLDGERSVVEYLLAPIIDSARRSLRES